MDSDYIFDIGDVVNLLSGGPFMTISEVHGDFINCMWFNNNGDLQKGQFPVETVEFSVPEEKDDIIANFGFPGNQGSDL
jgi:uncharacterized protein YodC (DUF2158 family)